jgi:hypothetical protein
MQLRQQQYHTLPLALRMLTLLNLVGLERGAHTSMPGRMRLHQLAGAPPSAQLRMQMSMSCP